MNNVNLKLLKTWDAFLVEKYRSQLRYYLIKFYFFKKEIEILYNFV